MVLADASSMAFLSDIYSSLHEEFEAQVCLMKISINATPEKNCQLWLQTNIDHIKMQNEASI